VGFTSEEALARGFGFEVPGARPLSGAYGRRLQIDNPLSTLSISAS